jgi:phosphoribosylformimino-5-aminoimidazole carboxamide ribotide isomerase
MGVARLILGTAACREPELLAGLLEGFPGEVFVGIDARGGRVAVEGWTETLDRSAAEVANAAAAAGAAGVIYTDISRDGTMTGPNFEAVEKMLDEVDLPVIASGGVAGMEDISRLAGMASRGLIGVIVGRAIYDGRVDLKEALDLVSDGKE